MDKQEIVSEIEENLDESYYSWIDTGEIKTSLGLEKYHQSNSELRGEEDKIIIGMDSHEFTGEDYDRIRNVLAEIEIDHDLRGKWKKTQNISNSIYVLKEDKQKPDWL